MDKITIKHL